jgi:CTD kinase subunit gamma CTK3
MAEAFQLRLEFTELLQSLSTAKKSIPTITLFAMKNSDIHADLFDCILAELTDVPFYPNLL